MTIIFYFKNGGPPGAPIRMRGYPLFLPYVRPARPPQSMLEWHDFRFIDEFLEFLF